MSATLETVVNYYDTHIIGKLRGFIESNGRVERAWRTVEAWAPAKPARILEIGCGIGDISWRMSRAWPEAQVTGMDISPRSIETAERLFGSSRLQFKQGLLGEVDLGQPYDLVILMDVYEHIACEDRPVFHAALSSLMRQGSRVILTFPTPRHLAWLRANVPDQIQPVDEDIAPQTILELGGDLNAELLMYQEVGIWHGGDYAHAVLERWRGWKAEAPPRAEYAGIRTRMRRMLSPRPEPLIPSREERLRLVHERLGREVYPG